METEFQFDSLDLIEFIVKIGKEVYIAVEADGEATAIYRDAMLAGTEINSEGKPFKLSGIAKLETLLLSRCLWKARERESGGYEKVELVSENHLKRWPNRIIKPIFEKIKVISELTEEKLKENPTQDGEPNATTVGSGLLIGSECPSDDVSGKSPNESTTVGKSGS